MGRLTELPDPDASFLGVWAKKNGPPVGESFEVVRNYLDDEDEELLDR